MLLNIRKNPDYLNNKILNELNEKWFSVYNYISLKELILTSRKDFLNILSKINIPFAIVSIILWVISYYSSFWFLLFGFLFVIYFIIFLIIFIKLLFRTKLFLYVSDVVYTKTGLMISDDFLYYKKDKDKIELKLEKYEQIFNEYLSKPSNLEEIISKKKKEVLDWSLKKSWKITEFLSDLSRSKEWWQMAIAILFSTVIYIISLYVFYYIWYFFMLILSNIYLFFLKLILSFRDKIELKIKKKTLEIDEKLDKMNLIYKVLKNKLDNFKNWEISNIWEFVEDKFWDFYGQIDLVLKDIKVLKILIEKSKYKDVIDFYLFKKYLKKNFNKPVQEMISLLELYEKLLEKEIIELKKLNKNSKKQKLDINNTEILDKNLEQKEFILNNKIEILSRNKEILKRNIL